VFGNKNANKAWVSRVVLETFTNIGKMTVNDYMAELRRALREKQRVMYILLGDGEKHYTLIYDYMAELRRVSHETCKIKSNQPYPTLQPWFGSFYMCLDGCKKGFLNGCRPFIGLDDSRLKISYGGQLLVVVARDPNDQYFPLAFVVVENECKETLRCFLLILIDDIRDSQSNRWVFISDQQKVYYIT